MITVCGISMVERIAICAATRSEWWGAAGFVVRMCRYSLMTAGSCKFLMMTKVETRMCLLSYRMDD